MINTLQDIANKLKYFCDVNYNINEYMDGSDGDFSPKDHLYPLLYSVPTDMKVSNGTVKYTFNLSLMDLHYENTDFLRLVSDLAITLSELQTYFDDDSAEFDYFVSLIGETTFSSFHNSIDGTVGWNGDVIFTVPFNMNRERINAKVDIIPDNSFAVYWGVSPETTLTEADVKDLAMSSQMIARDNSIVLHGHGQYIYYCYPVSFGPATFMVNGFYVTFEDSIVNVDGDDYFVYKSEYIQYGISIHIDIT